MDFPFRRAPEAGRTAIQEYERLLRRWRTHVALALFVSFVFSCALAVLSWQLMRYGTFFAGVFVGCSLGIAMWVWDDPPDYVARWKRGGDGERRTERQLRTLEPEWKAFHDRESQSGNVDHLAVGPGGVFLLDTKTLNGRITYTKKGLSVHFPGTARRDYTLDRLEKSLRMSAHQLSHKIKFATGLSKWVQPVVVVWGDFDGAVEGDGVWLIHGDALSAWLGSQDHWLSLRDQRLIELAIEAGFVARPAAAIA
jgi:hypothetical protein